MPTSRKFIKFIKQVDNNLYFNFNSYIGYLPPTLTDLTFGDEFNQPVNNLPSTITHLAFGY
jgi:hypothetical protein